jgi:hypothetical protein
MGDDTASLERSAVQKSANAIQRPSWDFISASLTLKRHQNAENIQNPLRHEPVLLRGRRRNSLSLHP